MDAQDRRAILTEAILPHFPMVKREVQGRLVCNRLIRMRKIFIDRTKNLVRQGCRCYFRRSGSCYAGLTNRSSSNEERRRVVINRRYPSFSFPIITRPSLPSRMLRFSSETSSLTPPPIFTRYCVFPSGLRLGPSTISVRPSMKPV